MPASLQMGAETCKNMKCLGSTALASHVGLARGPHFQTEFIFNVIPGQRRNRGNRSLQLSLGGAMELLSVIVYVKIRSSEFRGALVLLMKKQKKLL